MTSGWIGVDLDGTLAHYDGWRGIEHIGEPIPLMVERVKAWLAQGVEVRIFTARAYTPKEWLGENRAISFVEAWCEKHLGMKLPVTCVKDFAMMELYDDRAIRVEMNTGKLIGGM